MKRYLCALGDPELWSFRGGFLKMLLDAGLETGFLDGCLRLEPEAFRIQRYIWNAIAILRFGQSGGFQYSPYFLNRLIAQARLDDRPVELVSQFPLLPSPPWPDNWTVSFYIDATLKQIFEDYGRQSAISRQHMANSIARERKAYEGARFVICRSRWNAASVCGDYGIDEQRVFIVPPGANIPDNACTEFGPSADRNVLTLGFIGVEWQRKRLDLLNAVAEELTRREIATRVLAIGPPRSVQNLFPFVECVGPIDKTTDCERFVDTVREFHFGCLFSDAEALGISIIECQRLGIPVIGRRSGGIPEAVNNSAGFIVDHDFRIPDVADLIEDAWSPGKYNQLCEAARGAAHQFTWLNAVRNLQGVWDGDTQCQFQAAHGAVEERSDSCK